VVEKVVEEDYRWGLFEGPLGSNPGPGLLSEEEEEEELFKEARFR